ncbi:WD40-repeat-containing domain protein [Earliella scabrosa]|nr:WD40-repeat-containing domain protein [Earliella scabrosa]
MSTEQRTTPDAATWSPPVYNMSCRPRELHSTRLENGIQSNSNTIGDSTVFARLARWCPDGSVALAQCEDSAFRLFRFSPEHLGIPVGSNAAPSLLERLPQPSPVLAFAWYPSATIRDPASFCFVASVRECPVKLLDASDGRLRASYRIVDHRERQIAPHSVAFNLGANRLYCGFEDAIEVFDVHRPGEGTRVHTTPSKKSRDGLKGIISALAFAPDVSSDLYAAGSFSPSSPSSSNIALFSEAHGEVPVMFVGAEGQHVGAGYGVRASVSQLMFNPARPFLLYASFRRTEPIYCWDLRGDVSRPVEIYTTHAHTPPISGKARKTSTNQRLRFDIDYSGKWLAVGDEDGGISVFDLAAQTATVGGENAPHIDSAPRTTPVMQYDGHHDAVGSVAFHPLRPLLLSVSGSRHFDVSDTPTSSSSESSGSGSEDENSKVGTAEPSAVRRKVNGLRRSRVRPQPVTMDASVKLWDFAEQTSGGIGEDEVTERVM